MPNIRNRSCRTAALLSTVLMSGLLVPVQAHAQVYDRIAPKAPQTAPAPAVQAPSAAPVAPASDTVLLPALKGLVFIPSIVTLQKDGLAPNNAGPDGIAVSLVPLLADPAFTAQLRPLIGQPLTMDRLNQVTRLVDAWYRQHDRPFVGIAVPAQNIAYGVVQVVVEDYRVGQVKPEGNRYFSNDLLRDVSGLVQGQTLTLTGVQDSLTRLNDNPFRAVTTRFEPGIDPGVTDVVLETQDRLPMRAYATFDNAGVPSLGRGEWSVGANWGNAFGLDQQLSYQFTRGVTGRFSAHSLSWTAPLIGGDKLMVFGSFENSRPDAGPDFGQTGESGQASLRWQHALPRLSWANGMDLTQDLQAGYDYKTTNNNLEFGGVQVFANQIEVDQFPLIYDGTLTDDFGQTVLQNQAVYSPGELTGANNNAAFGISLPGASADYLYDRIALTRMTFLPHGFSWTARVIGQIANGNLPFSEQLGAGGVDSVRGYFTDTALGSEGVLVSQEIRAPAFSLAKNLGVALPVEDNIQPGVFWDYGHVAQLTSVANQINSADLSSIGVDLHATLGRYMDLRVDTGWQMRRAPSASDRGVFTDVALTIGF